MAATPSSPDDQSLASLLAPPDLGDGIESLHYWRERRRRLPWYRLSARREAALMTVRWEQRVADAMLSQHGAPLALRVRGGLLVARTRARRWGRRSALPLAGLFAFGLVVATAVVAISLASALVHAL